MDRIARFMELFWLTLGVVSALWTAWHIRSFGWEVGKVFTWFPMICFAMFFYRRFTRKRMARWAEHQRERSGL